MELRLNILQDAIVP